MINGLILDIDGVLVGKKICFSSPNRHPDVLEALHPIRQDVSFISLYPSQMKMLPVYVQRNHISQLGI